MFKFQSSQLISMIDLSNHGMNLSLEKNALKNDSLILLKEGLDLKIKRSYWGGYTLMRSKAMAKNKAFERIGLIGAVVSNPKVAIQLSDLNQPLVLVGDSKIQGDVKVSSKGIKTGSIGGEYYYGKTLVDGRIKANSGGLPKIESDWKNHIKNLIDGSSKEPVVSVSSKEVKNSFFDKTLNVYSSDALALYETYIGNVAIKSDKEIRITKYSKLVDVTVIAPKIIVESGFRGSVHLVASKNIIINQYVSLTYPSSLVVFGDQQLEGQPLHNGDKPIIIYDNSGVQGTVLYIQNNRAKDQKQSGNSSIYISEQAVVTGSIYCDGNLELEGRVHGNVYASRFVVNKDGSRYINHLNGGKVLVDKLPDEYGGLPLKELQMKIGKWLY